MKDRWEAFVRAVRTLVQGAGAAAAVAAWEAVSAAWSGGTYNARVLAIAAATAAASAVITYVYNLVAPHVGETGSASAEALVRAGRTLVQTLVGVAAVALWESVSAAWAGGVHNPRDLIVAGATAAGASVLAYLHNLIGSRSGPDR